MFHDHLVEHVTNFKKNIQKNIERNVVFVGVHCRRTDYINHLKKYSGKIHKNKTIKSVNIQIHSIKLALNSKFFSKC